LLFVSRRRRPPPLALPLSSIRGIQPRRQSVPLDRGRLDIDGALTAYLPAKLWPGCTAGTAWIARVS
jgi:hypothetical protein